MATFEIRATRIDSIQDHPNADKLEIAVIGGFRSLVPINIYKAGQYVIYLPEASVLQNWMIKDMNLWDKEKGKGVLAGKDGNRIKAIRLRGIVSQGLLWPVTVCDEDKEKFCGFCVKGEVGAAVMMNRVQLEEHDFAQYLGITKYEPEIPTNMAGEVLNAFGHTMKYDIENIQRFMDVFNTDDDDVVITEKLHGTLMCAGYDITLNSDEVFNHTIINSKGVSERGLCFKWNEANENNLYVKTFREVLMDQWDTIIAYMKSQHQVDTFYLLGEVFGRGVQDLHYGVTGNKSLRIFDIYVGSFGSGRYLNYNELLEFGAHHEVILVPILYVGKFNWEIMDYLRDGKETVSGKELNIREGIVVKTVVESRDDTLGRKQLKCISPDYLLRKGNTTEFN